MSTVPHLLAGEALALDYDYYQSGYYTPPTGLEIVGAALGSANGVYCAAIAVDGSFNIYWGQLPDALRGPIWKTAAGSQRALFPRSSQGPLVSYQLQLQTNGVLQLVERVSGTVIWSSGAPSDHSQTNYFAVLGGNGNLACQYGTPDAPGAVYWQTGTHEGNVWLQFSDDDVAQRQFQYEVVWSSAGGGSAGGSDNRINWLADRGAGQPIVDAHLRIGYFVLGQPHNPYTQLVDYHLGATRAVQVTVRNLKVSCAYGTGPF